MENIEDIRKRLKEAYDKSKTTYDKLESITGIGHSVINRYLTGKTKKIPLDDFLKICYAIGANPRIILGWVDEPINEPASKAELITVSEQLSPEGNDQLLEYAHFLADRVKKR